MRTLAMPKAPAPWSLTSLREKLIKIGAKVVCHGRYVTFQMAEVEISRLMFRDILMHIARLRAPPAGHEERWYQIWQTTTAEVRALNRVEQAVSPGKLGFIIYFEDMKRLQIIHLRDWGWLLTLVTFGWMRANSVHKPIRQHDHAHPEYLGSIGANSLR
jgi:DDE family transposase